MSEERSKALMWVTDEDLKNMGHDPKQVSEDQFAEIAEYMADYMDDNFQPALTDALAFVLSEET